MAGIKRPGKYDGGNRVQCFLDYNSDDVRLGGYKNKFYCTFNYIKLVKFTFKFGLQITHQKMLMAFNFVVAIYIVNKLLFIKI